MRAGWIIFAVLAPMLLTGVAIAQATRPVAEQPIIRRDAAAGGATGNPSGASAPRVALSLGAVLALIVGLYFAGRRFLPRGAFAQHGGGGGAVQVLGRTAIAPKQRVVLLQVGRRILVVADGGGNLNTLCEITDADEAAALIAQLQSDKPGSSFAATLNSAVERFRAVQHEPPPREPRPDLDSMRQEIEGLATRVRGMAR